MEKPTTPQYKLTFLVFTSPVFSIKRYLLSASKATSVAYKHPTGLLVEPWPTSGLPQTLNPATTLVREWIERETNIDNLEVFQGVVDGYIAAAQQPKKESGDDPNSWGTKYPRLYYLTHNRLALAIRNLFRTSVSSWTYSELHDHVGSYVEVSKEVSAKEFLVSNSIFDWVSHLKVRSDIVSLIGHKINKNVNARGALYASEGCWEVLRFCGIIDSSLDGNKITPDSFLENLKELGWEVSNTKYISKR